MRYFLVGALLIFGCGESRLPGEGTDSGTRRDTGVAGDATIPDGSRPDGSTPGRDGGTVVTDGGVVPADVTVGTDSGPELDLITECVAVCRQAVACGLPDTTERCASECLDTERFIRDPICQQLLAETFSCVRGLDCRGVLETFETGDGPCGGLVERFERQCGEDGRPPMPVPG